MWPHGLWPTRTLCPWNPPSKNTAVGWHFFLQGIFPTQRLNLCLAGRFFTSEPLGKPTRWFSQRQNLGNIFLLFETINDANDILSLGSWKSEPWLQNLKNERKQNVPKPKWHYLVGLFFHLWDFYGFSICTSVSSQNNHGIISQTVFAVIKSNASGIQNMGIYYYFYSYHYNIN